MLGGVAAIGMVAAVVAQSASGTYDLSWRALVGGGSSSGGNYGEQGVIGQGLSGTSSGGGFEVSSGFLGGGQVKFSRALPMLAKDGSN